MVLEAVPLQSLGLGAGGGDAVIASEACKLGAASSPLMLLAAFQQVPSQGLLTISTIFTAVR